MKKEVGMKTPPSLRQMNDLADLSSRRIFGNKSCIMLLMLGIVTLMLCPALWADDLPLLQILAPTPGGSIPEPGGPVVTDFLVKNNTGGTLELDYAFFQISWGGPDTSDNAVVEAVVRADLIITPGAIGQYAVAWESEGAPGCDASGCDQGVDPVIFAIEMSPLLPGCAPPVNSVSSQTTPIVWVSLGNCGPGPNPVALNLLYKYQDPQPALLYPSGIIGMEADGDPLGHSLVIVYDTPEPGSLLLLGSGLLGLAGLRRRRLLKGR
jgi:hypothetical protein